MRIRRHSSVPRRSSADLQVSRSGAVSTLARVRRIWARAGAVTLVVFPVWMLITFRATSYATEALASDDVVSVLHGPDYWTFLPKAAPARRAGSHRHVSSERFQPRRFAAADHAGVRHAGYRRRCREGDGGTRQSASNSAHGAIDGGNHSQFGYYGFQLGDWPATIGREEQQRRTLDALIAMRQRVSS